MQSCARLEVESQPFSLFSPVRAAVCLSRLAPFPPSNSSSKIRVFFLFHVHHLAVHMLRSKRGQQDAVNP